MNNQTRGTDVRKEIEEFQEAQLLGRDTFTKGKVGRGWCHESLQKNEHWIITKQGEHFVIDRSIWNILTNVNQMYDLIYDEKVEAKIANILEGDDAFTIIDIDIQSVRSSGFEKIDTKVTHPDYLLLADEMGCNTFMKKDGNVGNTKYIIKKGTVPQQIAFPKDH